MGRPRGNALVHRHPSFTFYLPVTMFWEFIADRFLVAEIRALHYSHGVGDIKSYERALKVLQKCERLTLRSLMRNSAERQVEVTVDRAKRSFLHALETLNSPSAPESLS
jgi:hypothetical protein